jgi:peptidoglycan/xylan/chitin deacetylase (PgdA/CDA1 family)
MLRGDNLATRYVFHPLARRRRSKRESIPILMYHSVSDRGAGSRHPYFHTVTTPSVFANQMRYLSEHGYRSISLSEAIRRLQTGAAHGNKAVVITFDDGYRDFYTNAYPVLAEHGLSACVFLPTSYIGSSAQRFNGMECMNWGEVQELSRSGIEFGAHTVSHLQLSLLPEADVRFELSYSKSEIENELQRTVTSFAYPYAFPETNPSFRKKLRGILEETGYQCGVSTIIGKANASGDRFFLRRLPVNSFDDGKLFQAKLDGGYDWMHAIQYMAKRIRPK